MNRRVMDLWVGVFVAIGFAAILFLALKVSNFSASGLSSTYEITARFDNIGGLKVRGPVKSAGVVVGRVVDIRFDPQSYEANVVLRLDSQYQFPRDTFASILTSGLLGEQYIGLDAGGEFGAEREAQREQRGGEQYRSKCFHRSGRRVATE